MTCQSKQRTVLRSIHLQIPKFLPLSIVGVPMVLANEIFGEWARMVETEWKAMRASEVAAVSRSLMVSGVSSEISHLTKD